MKQGAGISAGCCDCQLFGNYRLLPSAGIAAAITAILFLLGSLGIARVNLSLGWSLLFVGAGVAFLLAWKYAKRSASQGS